VFQTPTDMQICVIVNTVTIATESMYHMGQKVIAKSLNCEITKRISLQLQPVEQDSAWKDTCV